MRPRLLAGTQWTQRYSEEDRAEAAEVGAFAGDTAQQDDLTVVIIKRVGGSTQQPVILARGHVPSKRELLIAHRRVRAAA